MYGRIKVYLQTYLETDFEKITLFTLSFGEKGRRQKPKNRILTFKLFKQSL